MKTQAWSAVSGALMMWVLAVAWWLAGERSLTTSMGALAIGLLGSGIAVYGASKPAPTRRRALLAVALGAAVAAALTFFARA